MSSFLFSPLCFSPRLCCFSRSGRVYCVPLFSLAHQVRCQALSGCLVLAGWNKSKRNWGFQSGFGGLLNCTLPCLSHLEGVSRPRTSIYWLVLLQILRFWWHSIFWPSKLVPVPFSRIVCGTEIRGINRPRYSGHIHPVIPKPATQTLLWTELLHSDFRRAGWLSLETTLGWPLANSHPS